MNKFYQKLKGVKKFSILLLRLCLGTSFMIHGFSKFPLPPQKLIDYFNFSPFLATFVAISEVFAGGFLIISFFIKNYIGDILARLCGLIIVVIMVFAFYIAHKDWFINTKLFTSEQIYLILLGFYFFINGNDNQ